MDIKPSTQLIKYIPPTRFALTITSIKGEGLPKTHKTSHSVYYLVLDVDGVEYTTRISSKDTGPLWKEDFAMTANTSSRLKLKVFCAHSIKDNAGKTTKLSFADRFRNRDDHLVCESTESVICDLILQKQDGTSLVNMVDLQSLQKKGTITLGLRVDSLKTSTLSKPGDVTMLIPSPGPGFKKLNENWSRLFTSLLSFCEFTKDIADVDPKGKLAINAVSFVIKIINDQIERDGKIGDLAVTMTELYDWLQDGGTLQKINSFEKTVKKLLNQTSECSYFVGEYYKINSFLQRAVGNAISETDALITQYQSNFDQLRIELILGTTLQTALISVQILTKVTNIENQIYLDRLHGLNKTSFNPQQAAMRGTHCDSVIDRILNWAVGGTEDEGYKKRVFLLVGPEGCGKSSVSHYIARNFHEEKRLGCGIFLHSGVKDRDSQRISGTMIRDLAQYHPAIAERISGPIRTTGIASADIERQFSELFVDPLKDLEMVGPVLVIIDGLDESESFEERLRIFQVFADESLMTCLPSNFRFLITARPGKDLENVFSDLTHVHQHRMSHDPSFQRNEAMIRQTLTDLEAQNSPILNQHTKDIVIRQLLRRAAGDHTWTSLICAALQLTSTNSRIGGFLDRLILSSHPKTLADSIGQLYNSILQSLISHQTSSNRLSWNEILNRLLIFKSNSFFSTMPTEDREDIANVCSILQELGIITSPINGVDFSFAKSFEEFMKDGMRCTDHRIFLDLSLRGEICLDKMNELLRHNMCALPPTPQSDMEISDLTLRVKTNIPEDLQYAVKDWIIYILDVQRLTDALMKKLHQFLFTHLLHWIELLTVLGHMNPDTICPLLRLLVQHLSSLDHDQSYTEHSTMIRDAIRFVQSYSSMISRAHLHTYISALLLFPSYTLLHKTYIEEAIDERPRVSSKVTEVDPLYTIKRHDPPMDFVKFLPDGSPLLSAPCGERETRIINGSSGAQICLLKSRFRHAVFSPDNQRVAGDSDDGFRVWDVKSGELVCESLTGHRGISLVGYSRDGSKLLGHVGVYDICTWNADTGNLIGNGFIAMPPISNFSHDGQEVIIKSGRELEIWDVKLDRRIARLVGHKDYITEVVCSPDGLFIASVAMDWRVSLWDAKKKTEIVAFRTDSDWIHQHTMALSADSSRLSLVVNCNPFPRYELALKIWDLKSPNYNCDTKFITCRKIQNVDVSLDVGRIIGRTEYGEHLVWDIDSLPAHSSKSTVNPLSTTTSTITFHEPFDALQLAHHVDSEGWICGRDELKIVWIPKPRNGSYTVKRSVGKLEFLNEEGEINVVVESDSIE